MFLPNLAPACPTTSVSLIDAHTDDHGYGQRAVGYQRGVIQSCEAKQRSGARLDTAVAGRAADVRRRS